MEEYMIDKQQMAVRIRRLVGADGNTQREIAKRAGVNYNTLNRYMWEPGTPNAETIVRLAVYFGVSADYLLGLTDTP